MIRMASLLVLLDLSAHKVQWGLKVLPAQPVPRVPPELLVQQARRVPSGKLVPPVGRAQLGLLVRRDPLVRKDPKASLALG